MKDILKITLILLADSARSVATALVSSFGILFLISFLVMYITLRDSVKSYIETNLFGRLSINEIIIYPRVRKTNRLFSHNINLARSIPYGTVQKIRGMTELAEVHSIIKLDYEVKVRGEMMGQARRIHMPLCGIDRAFFKGKDPNWRRFRDSEPVPVVAPKAFIDLLNNYFMVIDVPPLDERTMNGFPLQLIITTSRSAEKPAEYTIPAEIHSLTDIFAFMGAIVPSDFITRFAREHRGESGKPGAGYKQVIVYAKVRDVKNLPAVTARIEQLGLTVESQNDIAQKTNSALEVFDKFSMIIVAVFLVLTVISIFNSYLNIVYNRSQKFSLKRVLGVSKLQILVSFVAESAVVGLLLGCIGYFLGKYAIQYISLRLSGWIPAFSGMTIQSVRGELLVLSLAFSVIISSISAFIPALFASNINLFKAVRK